MKEPEKIDWQQNGISSNHGHSIEYFIDGYVNEVKKYSAIGSYTSIGNELEEITEIE